MSIDLVRRMMSAARNEAEYLGRNANTCFFRLFTPFIYTLFRPTFYNTGILVITIIINYIMPLKGQLSPIAS